MENPLSCRNLLAGILVTVIGGVILAAILGVVRFGQGTSAPPAPSVSISQPGIFNIVNLNSNKCLDVTVPEQGNGAAVSQENCSDSGYSNQKWKISTEGGGYFHIVNMTSQMCIDIDGSQDSEDWIIQRRCDPARTSQLWQKQNPQGNYFQLVSKRGGKCLDVPGFSRGSTQIIYFDCNADRHNQNQYWAFVSPS